MDRAQADAVALAILEPDLKAQEELRRKREAEDRRLADQRLVAGLSLPAMAVGAAVNHFIGGGVATGVIWGGVSGGALGWAVIWWRRRRSAS